MSHHHEFREGYVATVAIWENFVRIASESDEPNHTIAELVATEGVEVCRSMVKLCDNPPDDEEFVKQIQAFDAQIRQLERLYTAAFPKMPHFN